MLRMARSCCIACRDCQAFEAAIWEAGQVLFHHTGVPPSAIAALILCTLSGEKLCCAVEHVPSALLTPSSLQPVFDLARARVSVSITGMACCRVMQCRALLSLML